MGSCESLQNLLLTQAPGRQYLSQVHAVDDEVVVDVTAQSGALLAPEGKHRRKVRAFDFAVSVDVSGAIDRRFTAIKCAESEGIHPGFDHGTRIIVGGSHSDLEPR